MDKKMSEWVKRNGGVVIAQLVTLAIIGAFGFWVRSATSATLAGYVDVRQYQTDREYMERRVRMLEDCLTKNIEFQQQVLTRLAAIETELKYTNKK